MKKILLYIALFLTISSANAQSYYQNQAVTRTSRWNDYARSQYFSVRLGFNASTGWFTHMSDIETSSRTGFNIGFIYGQQIASANIPLFVELGLGYSQKGFRSEFNYQNQASNGTIVTEHYNYRHNMNYMEIPLVIKYKFPTSIDDLTIQPLLGGFFDVGLSSDTYIYDPERIKKSTFGNDIFSRIDAGIRVGLGFAYQNLYLEMRYDIGLVNICGDDMQQDYKMYTNFDESAHNGCFSVNIGVDF